VLLLLILQVGFQAAIAQEKSMLFETTRIDGISIPEDGGPREFRFFFKNTGDEPLVVTRVATSCDCTVASYDKKPIPPGAGGEIKLVYHPAGHAGRLARTIAVYTSQSGTVPAQRLELNGEVTPARDKWAARYPVLLGGNLRAKRDRVSFGTVLDSQMREERVECVNVGDKPLKIGLLRATAPGWLTLETEPETIEPGEVADIVVKIDGKGLHEANTGGQGVRGAKTDGEGARTDGEGLRSANTGGEFELTLILEGLGGRPSARSVRVVGRLSDD
jgi:hypothetical protein